MSHKAYLSLGSNIGDRMANLKNAVDELNAAGIRVLRLSGVYETTPIGPVKQRDFFNMCAETETALAPPDVLAEAKRIESKLGRAAGAEKMGPRIIDIDMLFYDNIIIKAEGLKIPHASMQDRKFVLAPLAEIAPDYVHPALKKTVRQMLETGNLPGETKRLGELH